MAVTVKSFARSVVLWVFPRFPLINALTFLLLLAERAAGEKYPPFHPTLIYVHIGTYFVCGIGMGIEGVRWISAVAHAIHLICFSAAVYMSEALNYRSWVKMRMAHRMIGVAGFFLLFAYYSCSRPRPRKLKRMGEILIGFYALIATYMFLQSPEDKEAFLRFFPGGHGSLFIYATLLAAVGLCLIPGQFVYDLTVVLVVVLLLSTCLVDTRLDYWTKRRGLHYWNQINLLMDNAGIIVGAFVYLSYAKKRTYEDSL